MTTPLTDLIVSAAILDGGQSVGKPEVVLQLLHRLSVDGHVALGDIPVLLDSVMRRESLGSTGIGQGVALPHAKHASVTRPMAILALCRVAVDFDSIDPEPTDIIVLCLAPREQAKSSLRDTSKLGERLLRLFGDAEFRVRLRKLTSAEKIMELLIAVDMAFKR